MWTTLVVALSLAVPYLPQTDALCGGAAAAMVFRYWGDAHADVAQFAPLVDKQAGGIADDVLVKAIGARGWRTRRFSGSVDRLADELRGRRPIIILVADRGPLNHYLVVTGMDGGAVVVDDPAWGPSRRIAFAELQRIWAPTGFWSLEVLPGEQSSAIGTTESVTRSPLEGHEAHDIAGGSASPAPSTPCDARLDDAIDKASGREPDEAYQLLDAVRAQCPAAAGPLREMAGVRFAQKRWHEAAELAGQAVARDPADAYAWDLLASSRYMVDDFAGALGAWNHVGRPLVNLVQIDGLARTRYQRVAGATGLAPNMLLTERAFRLAARRLEDLPDVAAARLAFRPEADGFVTVTASVVEHGGPPETAAAWGIAALQAGIDREARVSIPGADGEGDLWSASWRWWNGRPRAAVAFAAPRSSGPRGWRVDASWDSQRYAPADGRAALDESRLHGGLSLGDWLTANLRYSIDAGLDSWRGASYTGRTVFAGGSIDRRSEDDRWQLAAHGTAWMPASGGAAFQAAGIRAAFLSSPASEGWVYLADAGAERASASAPLAIWPGAGGGHARDVLLRAHPLLDSGAIDLRDAAHAVFGRALLYSNAEARRWLASRSPIRVALAAFADVGAASDRQGGAAVPTQVDVGGGLRLHIPGAAGTLRLDGAHGLRDHADAFTVGWQF